MEKQFILSKKYPYILIGILALLGLYLASLYNYLLFHSLAEIFSIIVACGIFMIAWNSRRFLDNNYLLFIGIAYLFIASLELVHTLAYTGMNIFKGYETNLATQLWIATRYLESISLLSGLFFFRRKLKAESVFLVYTLATSLLLASIFYWDIFPTCFVEGVGLTPFKIISEYVISLILVAAIALLFKNRSEFDRNVLQWVAWSIILTIFSELAFTFYIHAYGFSNLVGHYLKIISFYLIYKAIIETGLTRPYTLLFRNLKQREEALQRERDKVRKYLDIVGVILVVIDSDQRVSLINKKGCVVLGYKEEEIIGKNWFDHFLPEAERNKVKAGFSKLITGDIQETEYSENLILTKSGEKRLIAWHSTLLRDEIGNIIATLSSGEDITEHKRADEALKWESELNLAKAELLNAVLATESVEDISSRVLEHARHLTRSEYGFAGYIDPETGYAITPTLTKDIWDICEVQDKDIVFKKFTGLWGWVLENQKPLLTNSPSQDPRSSGIPHGHVPIHRFLSAPALFEGKLVGQLALANSDRDYSRRDLELVEGLAAIFAIAIYHKRVDEALQKAKNELEKRVQERTAELSKTNELLAAEIAERKRTEIALKESETKYRVVADNTYDWESWVNPERHFIYVSPSCKRITHYDPKEFLMDPDLFLRIIHPDDRSVFIDHQNEVDQKLIGGEVEFRVVRPDGSHRWVGHACQPVFDSEGLFLGHRGSNRDITERKLAQQALQQSEEQLRYLSSQLLSAEEKERKRIARELHDGIGQSLTAIKFRVENVLQQMDRGKAKRIAEPLGTIIPLIQQSIEESRRIQMDLRPSILDDLGILATLSWFCREFQTTYSGISIEKLIDINEDDVPDSLKTVIYRISQEALNNVAKHSKADVVHLALRKSGGKIELTIQDNGDGFDLKEILPREGSERGLGLTSMRERTELSGGTFEIESTIGRGTTIRASWPL